MKEYLTVVEAAKIINVTTETMYSILTLNNFPVLKIPRPKTTRYRIHREGFENWIKTHSM